MQGLLKFFIIVTILLIIFGVGRFYQYNDNKESQWELVEAFPKQLPECLPPNDEEKEFYNLAVTILEKAGRTKKSNFSAGSLEVGAEEFLSKGGYRTEDGKVIPICAPLKTYEHVDNILVSNNGLSARLEEYQLELVAKIPNPSPYIVESVANSAFNVTPQQSQYFKNRDIRPFARTVLASFGMKSSKYADIAYKQISTDNALGTGAAQIAVATGHPDALPKIEKLMNNLLESIPNDKVVPREIRNRLYELAYAIGFGKEKSKKYTAPIKNLMIRRVQSWAPPFGMLEFNPKRMCEVLKNIEGQESITTYSYCMDKNIPLEQ